MMLWFSLLLVIYFGHSYADVRPVSHRLVVRQASNHGRSCQTPHNKSGDCIALKSCPSLYHLLLTDGQNSTTADLLRRSQCGSLIENGMPVVCCVDPIPQTTTRPATKKPVTENAATLASYAECGKSYKYETAIVGGDKYPSLGDWPWVVALGYNNTNNQKLDFKCGATLISNEWVLTAAHCVQNTENSTNITTALLGDVDLDPNVDDGATSIDVPISEIITHPEYSTSPITNDIALLRLKNPVQFSKYIRPACLLGSDHRSDEFYKRKRPFIVGWGEIEWRRDRTSYRLRETKVFTVVNQSSCATTYALQKSAKIDERVVCFKETGSYACQSNSACTLIFPVRNNIKKVYHFSLGGIFSFSVPNADLGHPGVYTRVAAFTDWIRKITGLSFDD